ncbi:polyhomeotic-like protein 2 isoform X2 [Dendronephthya gigantea]|uniref:polyhomeotic-like protein 2 isoform X2 n=1 Tax=Dendronephthya gigantea TaxID=151771 RepID=UPI0010696131|nr:polyhomeotic-like protein 2 isoform X2 [Dendronephthya gigantea]
MADMSTNGEPCVLNHFIENFIIQESSWPFTVKGQTYEFGKLPTDEPDIMGTPFFETENEDFATSEEESSEGSFDLDNCSYCGRACTSMARSFESKKFCSNTCARLFGIPVPKRGGYSGSGIGGRGRGGWKHYLNRKPSVTQSRKMARSYSNQSYEASTQVDETILREAFDGRSDNELDCLWQFEYVPAAKWNVKEVAAFVRDVSGCSEYAESFVSQEIDGYALMLVKEEHLVVGLQMKLGPALKLVGRVNQMKTEALQNMNFNNGFRMG